MRDFPCYNWGKAVTLMLQGYIPTRVDTLPGKRGEPKLVCHFSGIEAVRFARIFADLHSYGLDEQSAGRTPTAEELVSRANDLLDEFEAEAAKADAAKHVKRAVVS